MSLSMTRKTGWLYSASTPPRTAATASDQAARWSHLGDRAGDGVRSAGGAVGNVAELGRSMVQAGLAVGRTMAFSLTGRFTSAAKMPSAMEMYHTRS